MSEGGGVLGVIVAHGRMAEGLKDAVHHIAGIDEDALVAVSNEGRAPEELCRIVDDVIGDRPAVIFTDLQTGSCAVVARLVCREVRDRAAVFGVNLAILLDFAFHRDMPVPELVPRLLQKGRESVRAVPDFHAHADPPAPG